MATNFYIDGFNLYYGSLKSRFPNYKWLNIRDFCSALLPAHQVNRIRYFTAPVIPSATDPSVRSRQDVYLRALRTLPDVVVHDEGWFVFRKSLRYQYPLAYPPGRNPVKPQSVFVELPEEKGSDVNLASYLLLDAAKNDYDEAVVITNDSDLKVPIELAISEFGKTVGVINPHPKSRRSAHLASVASWMFQSINKKYFAASQLPLTLTDTTGTITKPSTWL